MNECPLPQLSLDYEPGEPTRRHRVRRRWTALAAVLVLAGTLWWQAPSGYRRLVRAYWAHQVANHVGAADLVVYEEDPGRWPALLAQPGYRQFPAASPGWNSYVAHTVRPVARLAEVGGLRVGATALFAHSRRRPDGRERLVVVWTPFNGVRPDGQGASADNQVRLDLVTSVIDGTNTREAMPSPWIAPQAIAENRNAPLYARIYAGQLDPRDATHFTIAFQIGQYADVLDGYLRDDDTVVLRPRKLDHPLNPK